MAIRPLLTYFCCLCDTYDKTRFKIVGKKAQVFQGSRSATSTFLT